MIRRAVAFASVLALVFGCSSSDDEPACTIAGTYTMVAAKESGTCADTGGAASTITITQAGRDYDIEIQGFQGGCVGTTTAACKLQMACDVLILDALSAANNVGTLQAAWAFDAKGFSGINSISVPPAKSLPAGCFGTFKATGTRR